MTLVAIILATLAAGIGSVWLAALLMRLGLGGRTDSVAPQHLLSLAAGAHDLFATLLVGVVFFFLLDKAELWHHGHEHSHAQPSTHGHVHADHDHAHDHGHAHHHHHGPRSGGWAVLTGDSVHCFGDGILIASAFMADIRLGVIAAVSVLAHEVPHHMGDLVVLRQTSPNRRMALVKVSLAGAVTALGGVVGYFLVGQLQDFLPYFLAVASSSFVYVALADLIPQLQKRLTARETIAQIAWLIAGMVIVTLVSGAAHAH